MSYDLTVYCPEAPTIEKVLLLVGNTRGLWCDPELSSAEASQGVLVHRGVKRSYSFTVDGPFAVEPEDLPDEVTAVLPEAATMFQVLVEGTVESEIVHGVRFAKKLAKACHGVAVDEQTEEVWPQPRVSAPIVPKTYPRVDAVEFMWYFLADEMPDDLPQRYLRLTTDILPPARPDTFGSSYPYMGDSRRDRDEGFIAAFHPSDATPIYFYATYPVTSGSLDDIPSRRKGDVRLATLTMAREAFADERFRLAAKQFFLCFAQESNAFHANAEVVGNYTLKNQKLLRGSDAEQHRYCVNQNTWAGLQGHPQWWTWYGTLYAEIVRPHLTGHLEDYPAGIFHSWTEHPADRDALIHMLPDPGQPWIPAKYSPVYEEGVVEPLSFAEWMPERLHEARVESLR